MREWRKTHPLTGEARCRDIARSYAHVYLRRGMLKRETCQWCGALDSQMHHADYSKPLDVTWLCKPCHKRLHVELQPRETKGARTGQVRTP